VRRSQCYWLYIRRNGETVEKYQRKANPVRERNFEGSGGALHGWCLRVFVAFGESVEEVHEFEASRGLVTLLLSMRFPRKQKKRHPWLSSLNTGINTF